MWKGKRKNRKAKLSEKHMEFVETYLATWNASKAALAAYPDVKHPAQLWYELKNTQKIKEYIIENSVEIADIQMDIIRDPKMPAAVRNDAIKFRLWVAGVNEKEEDDRGVSIDNITINIQWKKST